MTGRFSRIAAAVALALTTTGGVLAADVSNTQPTTQATQWMPRPGLGIRVS